MKLPRFLLGAAAVVALASAISSCGGGSDNSSANASASNESAIVNLTSDTPIAPDANLPIVIDFNAKWCGPCQAFAPTFDAVARQLKGKAIFMSVNVDNSPAAAQQFGVSAIPQISILMPDGTVETTVGLKTKAELLQFLGPIAR